jgi:3-phosphoshikimate 1-carboxyvinyltransferase
MDISIRQSDVDGVAIPPPSKSYTHRAFIASALSCSSLVKNPLISEDTIATLNGCSFLGSRFLRTDDGFYFRGVEKIKTSGYVDFLNSGTTMRFFIGLLSLSRDSRYSVLDGDHSLRKRPNKELVVVLKKFGAKIKGFDNYSPPVWIKGVLKGGRADISAASSQFISSLLFTLPLCEGDSEINVIFVKSRPYIDITLEILEKSGIYVDVQGNSFYIPGNQTFNLRKFTVPSDFSSTGYLIAAGILGGRITIKNVFPSKQGDQRIVNIIRDMNGKVKWDEKKGVMVAEKSELEGVEIDASDIPDLVPVISVLASVAKGRTVIKGVEHLRIKEIDRIQGILSNLHSIGVEAKAFKDGNDTMIEIHGRAGKFNGIIDSMGDHRMALAFSLLGLNSDELIVRNAEVVSVSFPGYFDLLKKIGVNLKKY